MEYRAPNIALYTPSEQQMADIRDHFRLPFVGKLDVLNNQPFRMGYSFVMRPSLDMGGIDSKDYLNGPYQIVMYLRNHLQNFTTIQMDWRLRPIHFRSLLPTVFAIDKELFYAMYDLNCYLPFGVYSDLKKNIFIFTSPKGFMVINTNYDILEIVYVLYADAPASACAMTAETLHHFINTLNFLFS